MKAMRSTRIVVVEDDSILREELCHFLRHHGFIVFEAMLGLTLDEILAAEPIDLILLDVNLPGESGFEIAGRIKSKYPQIGIAMLTARTALPDRLRSYESGADVYLPKPTHPSEIIAVLNSISRRISPVEAPSTRWKLDVQARELIFCETDQRMHLTAAEMYILQTLIKSKENKIEAGELCEIVSQKLMRPLLSKRAIENSISRFRKKCSEMASDDQASFIDSVWGYGYQLCESVSIV